MYNFCRLFFYIHYISVGLTVPTLKCRILLWFLNEYDNWGMALNGRKALISWQPVSHWLLKVLVIIWGLALIGGNRLHSFGGLHKIKAWLKLFMNTFFRCLEFPKISCQKGRRDKGIFTREGGREGIKYYIIFIVWWSFERTLLRNTEFYLIITFLEIDITSRSESQHVMDL